MLAAPRKVIRFGRSDIIDKHPTTLRTADGPMHWVGIALQGGSERFCDFAEFSLDNRTWGGNLSDCPLNSALVCERVIMSCQFL